MSIVYWAIGIYLGVMFIVMLIGICCGNGDNRSRGDDIVTNPTNYIDWLV